MSIILLITRYTLVSFFLILCLFTGLARCAFLPFHSNTNYFFGKIFNPLALKILGLKLEVKGTENINNGPAIYIANHQSNWDFFVVLLFIPPNTLTLGKKEIAYFPIFGQLYWLANNILINRKSRKSAKESMTKVHDSLTKEKNNIVIMPEGTRNHGKGLRPFKNGAFALSENTKTPIIPVCVSSWHKGVNLRKINSGTLSIEFLKAIPPTSPYSNQKEMAYNKMSQALELLG